jgi:hypothetical protein
MEQREVHRPLEVRVAIDADAHLLPATCPRGALLAHERIDAHSLRATEQQARRTDGRPGVGPR